MNSISSLHSNHRRWPRMQQWRLRMLVDFCMSFGVPRALREASARSTERRKINTSSTQSQRKAYASEAQALRKLCASLALALGKPCAFPALINGSEDGRWAQRIFVYVYMYISIYICVCDAGLVLERWVDLRTRFVSDLRDMNLRQIVSDKQPDWFSPSSNSMYCPYVDIAVAREAHRVKNLRLQQYSWLTQLAEPRRTILRKPGTSTRYLCIGHSCGELGWMWALKESDKKCGLWVVDGDQHQVPFVVFSLQQPDSWLGQDCSVVYTLA